MTLNPIAWVRRWLDRRRQEKIDLECYRRMRNRVDDLHKWCGVGFPILNDVSTWLLRGDARCRGYSPKPDYHPTDGQPTIDSFREYLRATYPHRHYDHEGRCTIVTPQRFAGTYSPTEIPVEIVPPTGGSSVQHPKPSCKCKPLRPSPTPFQFENAPQRPRPRKPKEIG